MNERTTFTFDDPSGDVGRSAADIIDGRPTPTESPIETAAASAPVVVARVDDSGVAFDASLHAVGADGEPVKTARGSWRKKRGTGTPRKLSDPRAPSDAPKPLTQAELDQARATGAMIAENIMALSQAIGGPDFEPRTHPIDDRQMLTMAWQNYCVAQQITELSPGWFLLGAHVAYITPRFTMERTQSRLTSFKIKVAAWWLRRKDAKKRRKGEAQSADADTERALS